MVPVGWLTYRLASAQIRSVQVAAPLFLAITVASAPLLTHTIDVALRREYRLRSRTLVPLERGFFVGR